MNSFLKLNLGCGNNPIPGYINVDKFGTPDVLHDLETFPWPWQDNTVEEIRLYNVLEHLGEKLEIYFGIIKELYRICISGAKLDIIVPHPRHDDFINDPTHVRIVTPESLLLFSKSRNLEWMKHGNPNSPLGLYLNIDFEIEKSTFFLDPIWLKKIQNNEIDEAFLNQAKRNFNNVAKAIQIILIVKK